MELVIETAVGIIAYILYFIYDYNSITRKNRFAASFFTVGTLMIIGSTVSVLVKKHCLSPVSAAAAIVAFIFLGLLVYTLFFALPFTETYVKESELRKTYTGGVYSICRHPGVLWLVGMYLCFIVISADLSASVYYGIIIAGDILYVVYQDIYIFPRTFSDYDEYKKTTPFLIPGLKKKKSA